MWVVMVTGFPPLLLNNRVSKWLLEMWLNCQLSSQCYTDGGTGRERKRLWKREAMREGRRGERLLNVQKAPTKRVSFYFKNVSSTSPPFLSFSHCLSGDRNNKIIFVQTRLLLTENWRLLYLLYKQWDIEWLLGSRTLSTNGFSSGNVGGMWACHRLNVVAPCLCVFLATEVKYFYSFDNNMYIWGTWKWLALWK